MNGETYAKRRRLLGAAVDTANQKQHTAKSAAKRQSRPSRKGLDVELRPVMSIEETAAYLNLSPQMIYAEVRKGRLPIVQFGRRKLVVRALLDEMLIARAKENWNR
ncbi:MAG TPA: helix-turn-helix domain-containing protein [Candidatus Baltobacteraceae bacterium]|nr:helix-turn-helix domain-containing protein [Candidatus Baltobacteraceae bacterium]